MLANIKRATAITARLNPAAAACISKAVIQLARFIHSPDLSYLLNMTRPVIYSDFLGFSTRRFRPSFLPEFD